MPQRPLLNSVARWTLVSAAAGCLLAGVLATSGCALFGAAAVIHREAKKQGKTKYDAAYKGLEGKTFAVVVSVDRFTQADYPMLVPGLTGGITERLRDNVHHAGHVPAERLMAYLYEHPRWVAMPRGKLAAELGVDRIVWVEVLEYRHNSPGNAYEWDGSLAGTVGIIEADSPAPDDFAYEKPIRVKFPDQNATLQEDSNAQVVATRLMQRYIDRASWLMYDHEEPNSIEY